MWLNGVLIIGRAVLVVTCGPCISWDLKMDVRNTKPVHWQASIQLVFLSENLKVMNYMYFIVKWKWKLVSQYFILTKMHQNFIMTVSCDLRFKKCDVGKRKCCVVRLMWHATIFFSWYQLLLRSDKLQVSQLMSEWSSQKTT